MRCLLTFFMFLSICTLHAHAQGVIAKSLGFGASAVGTRIDRQIEISNLVGSGSFVVRKNVESPFFFLNTPPELAIRSGKVVLKFSFNSVTSGDFQDELILERSPVIGPNNDVIRVKLGGAAFRPERMENVEFGRTIVSDTSYRHVIIRAGSNQGVHWKASTLPSAPFELITRNGPIQPGNTVDTLLFVFGFAPMSVSRFRDTCQLVRSTTEGVPLDTIVVFLSGEGVSLSHKESVEFKPTLTADSVSQSVKFPYRGNSPNYKYQAVKIPTRPFSVNLVGGLPKPFTSDSGIIAFDFEPTEPGQFADTLIIRRSSSNSQIIDSIYVLMSGSAQRMSRETEVEFLNRTIGSTTLQTTKIQLPIAPRTKSFTYRVLPVSSSPVSAVVLSPLQASKEQEISVELTCAPTSMGSAVQGLALFRFAQDGRRVDSTIIVATTTVAPRVVNLIAGFPVDTTKLRIGDTASVNIILTTDDPIDAPVEVKDLACELTYNATLVAPVLEGNQRVRIENDTISTVIGIEGDGSIFITQAESRLVVFKFVALVGDTDRTAIRIWKCNATVGDVQEVDLGTATTQVFVTNVWRYMNGASRFVNTLQGQLTLDVDPNPVVGMSTLRIQNVPQKAGTLIIASTDGREVADFTAQVREGQLEFTLSTSGSADVVLTPGTYVARLIVQDLSGLNLYSVVRHFVVQ